MTHHLRQQSKNGIFSSQSQEPNINMALFNILPHPIVLLKCRLMWAFKKEHLIVKILLTLKAAFCNCSLSLLFINEKHMTKLLKTAMAYAAVLNISLHHPDTVFPLLRTGECLWKRIYLFSVQNKYTLIRIMIYKEFSVLLIYPQQFYKNCLYQ